MTTSFLAVHQKHRDVVFFGTYQLSIPHLHIDQIRSKPSSYQAQREWIENRRNQKRKNFIR